MSTKVQKVSEKNGSTKSLKLESIWLRAIKSQSEWPDKEEFLDVIYWIRQALGIIVGVLWGLIPLKGYLALLLFVLVNAGVIYVYFSSFQTVDEEEYGGAWELTKEGFMTSFAGFLRAFASTEQCRFHCSELVFMELLMECRCNYLVTFAHVTSWLVKTGDRIGRCWWWRGGRKLRWTACWWMVGETQKQEFQLQRIVKLGSEPSVALALGFRWLSVHLATSVQCCAVIVTL
ncbi:hypothetical protein LSTR_LSTR000858 [Laodelphax striatellus]|uniref:Uncharacterized protein n=1 Tax=Laodelphax striatellus TaxID=195883 RepID=A0A482X0G3_LAOST|nr:hypothetical protein LSTR_LSTR000858 [Laodelphax striatellus]